MKTIKEVGFLNHFDLKSRSDLHLARKIWHIVGVSIIASLYLVLPRNVALVILGVVTAIAILIDVMRQKNPALNELFVHVFGIIMRKSEINKLAGTTFLLSGVSIVIIFFNQQVAGLALFFLAFADPIASFCGILWGKDKILGNKSLQGFLAAFAVCTVACFIYLYLTHFLVERMVVVSLVAGLAGAFAELIPIGKLDDNLTFPILSAIALQIIFTLFGGFAI